MNDILVPVKNISKELLPDETQLTNELDSDTEYAKKNITNLIETGIASCQELSEIVSSSQRASDYTHLSSMLKTVSELNKDLISVSKIRKENSICSNSSNKTINNNLFVGSATEFQKMLEQFSKKE